MRKHENREKLAAKTPSDRKESERNVMKTNLLNCIRRLSFALRAPCSMLRAALRRQTSDFRLPSAVLGTPCFLLRAPRSMLHALLLAFSLQPLAFSLLSAAPFDCGSTGAYGPMNITSNTTLQLPPDGIFHCTTITVAPGVTLKFANNALNTPVYLLATGDVNINGTIDVSGQGTGPMPYAGKGGPGGFDGGYGGGYLVGQAVGGNGLGPGGARIFGAGTFATGPGQIYGNTLMVPLIGGSGSHGCDGNVGYGGAGGGGAMLIASNTRISLAGTLNALGGNGYGAHSGSGGAIRLVAPLVGGDGSVNVTSGTGYSAGGYGRIRIDCTDLLAYRSLTLYGIVSRGNRMFVFPAAIPRLDILEVAGTTIPEGTNSPAIFELAGGTSTNQFVKVQARNYTNDVPIRVVVTPANGPSGQFDATILQSSGNPPFVVVPVVIPSGSECTINAWTR